MIKLSSIKFNPNNPRIIKDDKFKQLVKSKLDPKYCQVILDRMLKLDNTLIVNKNGQPYQVTEKSATYA